MVYGKSKYPGLEGFSLEVISNEIILKSTNGTRYSPLYLFDLNVIDEAKIAIANGDTDNVARIANQKNNPRFY